MEVNQSEIQKRQEFYWRGKKFQEEGNYTEAIESYKIYSNHLSNVDKHIPHQWISGFYEILNEKEKSLFHLEKYAQGCTPLTAAEVYKEIGEKYLELNVIHKAVTNFELAIKNNANIGVKTKLKELKNRLK